MGRGGKRSKSGRPRLYGSKEGKATAWVGVRFEEQDLQRLKLFADKKGLTLSDAIRFLAEEFLKREAQRSPDESAPQDKNK